MKRKREESTPPDDEMAEISAEELMSEDEEEDLDDTFREKMEIYDEEEEEEEEMRVPKEDEGNEEENSFVADCQPSSSNVSDSAIEENQPDEASAEMYADTSLLVISEKKKRRKRPRREELPPKGTKEYKEIRRADAKRRRIENKKNHRCPFCPFTAAYPSKVKLHLETNHRQGRHECDLCDLAFDTPGERRRHSADAHPVIHTCDHCGYIGKKPCEVRRHIYLNHEKGIKCTIPGCNVTIAKWYLKRHLREKHEEAISMALSSRIKVKSIRSTCTECDFSTTEPEEMDDHYDRVHNSAGIDCPHEGCGEKLPLAELREHLELDHLLDTPELLEKDHNFTLPRSKSSKSSKNRRLSQEGDEDDEEASTSALTASETYATTSGFVDAQEQFSDDHLSEDDGEDSNDVSRNSSSAENKPPMVAPARRKLTIRNSCGAFACEACGSTFDELYLLKKHVKRTHERTYSESRKPRVYPEHRCTFEGCSKTFRNIGSLQDHLNAHNNIFPFHCDHCDQHFHARARFAVHLSKYHHTSIRVYSALRRDLPTSSSSIAASTSD